MAKARLEGLTPSDYKKIVRAGQRKAKRYKTIDAQAKAFNRGSDAELKKIRKEKNLKNRARALKGKMRKGDFA